MVVCVIFFFIYIPIESSVSVYINTRTYPFIIRSKNRRKDSGLKVYQYGQDGKGRVRKADWRGEHKLGKQLRLPCLDDIRFSLLTDWP